ncbi:MAG: single-stranded-DNA-specific exonuclease RecJ [Desulfobacteraceae bacterium]|uniref:Single-stranded-DNA-specific exonuclease RecJ n=1 Tax=Candidatus Desulfacyla euxinica TaxID=2841693 RepID=A0A8J6T459_9DELT|nr:single-stranded-DNA-specific exonuclease RecJ [Candidatus Desulfacyla euxinica]MBL6977745.1 single-stranded-DNA-specific exonuclease RecJ [Desulfobacteraceae bacterium]
MSLNKIWKLKPASPDASQLARRTGITPLQAQLLINRGITESIVAQSFLSPRLSQMADPMLMKGMDSAVKTILAAMETRDKITIYGDYDADGLTATAVLVHFFSDLGIPVTSYVPNRLEEGYGLNREAVEQIGRNGTGLIITVDCGISGAREIDLAKDLGLKVVVTDHHQMSGELRLNCPVINPHQPDCPFPFKDLAGVGLAFFLAVAIRAALRGQGWFKGRAEPDLREYLDLVALGTVADRVPLLGQNRMLVKGGMRCMTDSRWPGINAMMDVASVKSSEISSDDLAFRLAPRLNAPGRLGDSDVGLQILTVTEGQEAKELAQQVNIANGRRQRLEQSILDRIEEIIRSERQIHDRRTLLLWGENWHQGVLGIVASRLVERYHRPSLVVGVKDGVATGSGRSIDGFNLYKALSRLTPLFQKFGGHAHAAGFRLDEGNLEILRDELEGLAQKEMISGDLVPTIDVDADLLLKDIDREMIHQITALSPFGQDNPEPVFRARSLHVSGSRVVGERHLKLRLRQGETILEAIAFGFGLRHPLNGKRVDIIFTPGLNKWQGSEKIQLKIVDLKECSA